MPAARCSANALWLAVSRVSGFLMLATAELESLSFLPLLVVLCCCFASVCCFASHLDPPRPPMLLSSSVNLIAPESVILILSALVIIVSLLIVVGSYCHACILSVVLIASLICLHARCLHGSCQAQVIHHDYLSLIMSSPMPFVCCLYDMNCTR